VKVKPIKSGFAGMKPGVNSAVVGTDSTGTIAMTNHIFSRRHALSLLASAPLAFSSAHAQAQGMSKLTAFAFSFTGLDGANIKLADYAGKPILVVNTASQCGYTPQFTGLQKLWAQFHDRGLMIVAVPSNDFGGQEPGDAREIAETANHQYGVKFPIAAKAVVKGAQAHPFFKWAAAERPREVPKWNFHKYLIGDDGYIAAVFPTEVEPTDTRVVTAIAKELPA
jgi:glutathione peroxidase